MLRNTRVQMAAVLAVGALLGCLATSGRLSPFPRACAGQSLAQTESSSGARPACRDEVNRGQLLALAAPEETAAAPEAQTGAQEIITFVVRLPADAVLEIDGKKTQATGEERRFETPPLRVGGTYQYTLKATSQGKEVTRQINLRHGAENGIDLRPAFGAVAAKQPGSR